MPSTLNLLAQNLHQSNARLCFWLDSLFPSHTQPQPVTPEQMAGLLSELMRAGGWLRELPPDPDPALAEELGEYRRNVERLRALLPSVHRVLLEERARLEQERARVASAEAWAGRSSQTL